MIASEHSNKSVPPFFHVVFPGQPRDQRPAVDRRSPRVPPAANRVKRANNGTRSVRLTLSSTPLSPLRSWALNGGLKEGPDLIKVFLAFVCLSKTEIVCLPSFPSYLGGSDFNSHYVARVTRVASYRDSSDDISVVSDASRTELRSKLKEEARIRKRDKEFVRELKVRVRAC